MCTKRCVFFFFFLSLSASSRTHYVEYLVGTVSKAQIDPLPILDLTDCVQELRRRGIPLPERGPWDTDEIYREMCQKVRGCCCFMLTLRMAPHRRCAASQGTYARWHVPAYGGQFHFPHCYCSPALLLSLSLSLSICMLLHETIFETSHLPWTHTVADSDCTDCHFNGRYCSIPNKVSVLVFLLCCKCFNVQSYLRTFH